MTAINLQTFHDQAEQESPVQIAAETQTKFSLDDKIDDDKIVDGQIATQPVEAPGLPSPEDEAADKRLVRKIDRHIMPLLFCCYGLQYMDKLGVASGVAFGLVKDNHLMGQQYSWLSTGFHLAYLLAEFPMNYLMQRYPIDRVLAICCAVWGVCVFGIAASQNFTQLMACRALLGIGEAAALPGFLIITTAWYRKTEQQIRVQLWVISNPVFSFWVLMVFYALGKNSKAIPGWRSIHSLSVLWAVVVWIFLATPRNARWLTPDERKRAHDRLIVSQQGESESGISVNWEEVREAFTDPMVWWSLWFSFCYCLSNGGNSAFASYILQSFELSGPDSIAYQIPNQACFLLGLLIAGYLCHRYQHKNINLFCCMAACVPALIGIFLQALLSNKHRWGRIVGYWLVGFFPVNIYIVWAQNGLNVAGRTKKSTVQGGAGSGPQWHGESAVHVNTTNTRIGDVEMAEKSFPLIIREFSIRKNSGGKGTFTGGDGVHREYEARVDVEVSHIGERRVTPPYGMQGGQPGERGATYWIRNTEQGKRLVQTRPSSSFKLKAGDRIIIHTPGGGGYGGPAPSELVVNGLTSPKNSSRPYWRANGSLAQYSAAQETCD